MQYPRKNVPHMPATIPAINLELIFKTVVKVENKNTLYRTRRKLQIIRSRCADCAAAQSEYLPSLLCAIVEGQRIGGGVWCRADKGLSALVWCFGHPCDLIKDLNGNSGKRFKKINTRIFNKIHQEP